MPSPRNYRAEAVVLRQMKLGEADRILTLYTGEFGKVRAVAKGVRRPGSKLGGNVDLLTRCCLMLARGRSLDIVTQAETIDGFVALKSDLDLLSRGLYVAELVDCFTEERMESPAVFSLVIDTLSRLAEGRNAGTVLRYFELHLVHHLGYRPELRRCAACDRELEPVTNCFHPASGGMLCPRCSYDRQLIRPLTLNAFRVLRLWQECDFSTASRIKVDLELARELEMVMRIYIRHLLEREVKTVAWLDKLRQDEIRAAPRAGV